jgi:hypothetical protein
MIIYKIKSLLVIGLLYFLLKNIVTARRDSKKLKVLNLLRNIGMFQAYFTVS